MRVIVVRKANTKMYPYLVINYSEDPTLMTDLHSDLELR